MSYGSLLRHRVTIRHRWLSQAADDNEYLQDVYEVGGPGHEDDDVAAFIDETTGREITLPGEGGNVITAGTVYLPRGTALTEHDQILQTRPETGRAYEVVWVRDGGGQGHHPEADVVLVR